jgi:hypothetical protein
MIDQGSKPDEREDHFGLLRADGSEKPAYVGLKNLISILDDRGPRFTPGKLAYGVTGDTVGVRRLVLQRRDGRFYLALWQAGSSFDLDGKRDLPHATKSVTLRFQAPAGAIRVYRPLESGLPSRVLGGSAAIDLSITDQLMLVEITP